MYNFFDINKLTKLVKITPKQIEKIKRQVHKEFADDQMMYELHLLRALHSYAQKAT